MIRFVKILFFFLFVIFILLVGYGESCLNFGFFMSELIEGMKRKVIV